jgi:hypothetical protein
VVIPGPSVGSVSEELDRGNADVPASPSVQYPVVDAVGSVGDGTSDLLGG